MMDGRSQRELITTLAQLIRSIRPSWDYPGIVAALQKASIRHDSRALIRAAVDAAYDPSARTPGVIHNRDGRAWRQDETPPPQPARITDLDLGQPQPDHVATRGAAAARAALRQDTP